MHKIKLIRLGNVAVHKEFLSLTRPFLGKEDIGKHLTYGEKKFTSYSCKASGMRTHIRLCSNMKGRHRVDFCFPHHSFTNKSRNFRERWSKVREKKVERLNLRVPKRRSCV
jgi:hypothetical protein